MLLGWIEWIPKSLFRNLSELLLPIDKSLTCSVLGTNLYVQFANVHVRYPLAHTTFETFQFCVDCHEWLHLLTQLEASDRGRTLQFWDNGVITFETCSIPYTTARSDWKWHKRYFEQTPSNGFQIASRLLSQMFLHCLLMNPAQMLWSWKPSNEERKDEQKACARIETQPSALLTVEYWKRHQLSLRDVFLLIRYSLPEHVWLLLLQTKHYLSNMMIQYEASQDRLGRVVQTYIYDTCCKNVAKLLYPCGATPSKLWSRDLCHSPPLPVLHVSDEQVQTWLRCLGPRQVQPFANYGHMKEPLEVFPNTYYVPTGVYLSRWKLVRISPQSVWEAKYGCYTEVWNQYAPCTFYFDNDQLWLEEQECLLVYCPSKAYKFWGLKTQSLFEKHTRWNSKKIALQAQRQQYLKRARLLEQALL